MEFEAKKSERSGGWRIHFGKLLVMGVEEGGRREAERRCRVLNADPETVERARAVETCIAEGAEVKLWHVAAMAVVAEKRGDLTPAEHVGLLLWERMKEFRS